LINYKEKNINTYSTKCTQYESIFHDHSNNIDLRL
jgi:hypothetical protein